MVSVITRNREILKRILLGDSYETCAKDYHFSSIPSVQNGLRAALESLREHTDIDIIVTTSHHYLMQHKDTILDYLKKPYPKTDLLYNARRLLQKHFGKYYASMPGEISQRWDEIKKEINSYHYRRELNSIKEWLSAEGYLIDDYISNEMLDFALDNLTEKIKDLDISKGNYSFKINDIAPHLCQERPARLLRVEISEGEHRVNKVITLEMA